MTPPGAYPGTELELFRHAMNWKRYLATRIRPHLSGDVIEVGAGLGAMTPLLLGPTVSGWLCLEPDPEMAAQLSEAAAGGALPPSCRAQRGTVADLPEAPAFDAALYVDVLEHIEDDRAELERVSRRLWPGGRIVVLSPAHQWLFTPFDAAIGHFRRYRRADAARLTIEGFELQTADFLDSVGLAASLANKLLLRSAMPTLGQILTWDRLMVPLSRWIDPLVGRHFGKSILFVWRKI